MLEQIKKYGGNISAISRAFQKSRQTIYTKIKEYKLDQELDNAREEMLDNVESALYKKAIKGDTTAMIFILKTRGKNRGYTQRHEITGAEGTDIHVKVAGIIEDDDIDGESED